MLYAKFDQNQLSGSEKVQNVNKRTDGQADRQISAQVIKEKYIINQIKIARLTNIIHDHNIGFAATSVTYQRSPILNNLYQ